MSSPPHHSRWSAREAQIGTRASGGSLHRTTQAPAHDARYRMCGVVLSSEMRSGFEGRVQAGIGFLLSGLFQFATCSQPASCHVGHCSMTRRFI